MKKAILAALLFSLSALAADVTGTWTGTLKAPDRDVPAYFILKQQGTAISGSIGGAPDDQHTISTGKIEGDQITIQAKSENGNYKLSLKLAADGNTLSGDVERARENGDAMKAPVELKRSK